MKKRNYVKQVTVGLSMLMAISLAGCAGNVEKSKTNETDTTTKKTIEVKVEEETERKTEVKTETKVEVESETKAEVETETEELQIDYEEFINLEEIEELKTIETTSKFEDGSYMTTEGFVTLYDIREDFQYSVENVDEWNRIYRGEYALYGDTKCEIVVADYCHHVSYEDIRKPYIEINGIKKRIYLERFKDIAIIDLDTTDEYKEVVVLDDGPSADPYFHIYRYDGEKIYQVCEVFGQYDFAYILFDTKGNIIDISGYVEFLDTHIVNKYYTCKDDVVEIVHTDYESALNKTYTINDDMCVAFTKCDIDDENVYLDINKLYELKKGDKIKLIRMDNENDIYYIQLPDGRKGYMTRRIAG